MKIEKDNLLRLAKPDEEENINIKDSDIFLLDLNCEFDIDEICTTDEIVNEITELKNLLAARGTKEAFLGQVCFFILFYFILFHFILFIVFFFDILVMDDLKLFFTISLFKVLSNLVALIPLNTMENTEEGQIEGKIFFSTFKNIFLQSNVLSLSLII